MSYLSRCLRSGSGFLRIWVDSSCFWIVSRGMMSYWSRVEARRPVVARMLVLGITSDSVWWFDLDEDEWLEGVATVFGALVWAD